MKQHIYAMGCCVLFLCIATACKNDKKQEESTGKTETITESDSGTSNTKSAAEKQEETAYPEGKKTYQQYCATCHQTNGSGVPNLNPPLRDTEYVTGNKTQLIDIILNGSDAGLEVNGQTYANVMPPHSFLNDKQIAELLSYIRNSFGNSADPVTESEVRTVREDSAE